MLCHFDSVDFSPAGGAARPQVFLSGWGFIGRVGILADQDPALCPVADDLLDPEALAAGFGDWLARQGIEQCEIVGWSLGGRCALELARRYPERISAVHLLAVRAAWPADEIDAICRELARQPVDFLRSFYRKCFLGYKEAYRRFQQKLEEKCLEQARRGPEVLERGLELLAAPMPEAAELPAGCRVYCLHGRRDVIAPVEQRLHWPGATSRILEHGGHALFLDYPAAGPHIPASNQAMIRRSVIDHGGHGVSDRRVPQVAASETAMRTSVRELARSPQDAVPCDRLRHRFSRAAATYDANAEIQKQTLELLAGRLPPDPKVKSVLELGCGTGNWTRRLLNGLPRAHITALDFSEEMLRQAREKCPHSSRLELLCREGEDFLAANRQFFDLITANATLQWFADLPRSLALIREALTPGGRLLTTIFGCQSLRELDTGLQAVSGGELRAAARDFVDYPALQSMVTALFPAAIVEEYFLSRRFNDLGELLRHFRYTGTGGPGRPAAFTPRHYRELSRWFADQPQGFQISFQVFLVQAGKE